MKAKFDRLREQFAKTDRRRFGRWGHSGQMPSFARIQTVDRAYLSGLSILTRMTCEHPDDETSGLTPNCIIAEGTGQGTDLGGGLKRRPLIADRCSGYFNSWPAKSPSRNLFGLIKNVSTNAPFGEWAMCLLPPGRQT